MGTLLSGILVNIMNDIEIFEMIERMEQFGGSFVVALSKAIRCADFYNKQRIIGAFPDYVEKYGPNSKFAVTAK
jgi:hypothetical protein